jgi:hypothetical protein
MRLLSRDYHSLNAPQRPTRGPRPTTPTIRIQAAAGGASRLHALVCLPCSLLWKTSNTVNLPSPPNIIHMSKHVLGLHVHYPGHVDFL